MLIKSTTRSTRAKTGLNRTRQFRAESEKVNTASPFDKLVALTPSLLGGGLVVPIKKILQSLEKHNYLHAEHIPLEPEFTIVMS